jgi:enoyl-CoA hydratase/carnithine racemase
MLGVDSPSVLFELDGNGVLLLTLHRPDRNNAWNPELEQALHDLLLQAATSAEVRAIVLTGSGRSFCPGMDSENLSASAAGSPTVADGRRRLALPALVPKPVVCAINGACAGFGLVTALMCDVRFANEGAKITTAFAKRGLPAEQAASWVLPRIVGHAVALDLLLSSRTITGRDAARLGLVNDAVPAQDLLPAALEYARAMAASCSPASMAVIKAQVYRDWAESFDASHRDSRRLVEEMRWGDDFREGVRSFVEKRSPRFAPHTESPDPDDVAM